MLRLIGFIVIFVIFSMLILPLCITAAYGNLSGRAKQDAGLRDKTNEGEAKKESVLIKLGVGRPKPNGKEIDQFEQYILRVVAAEMPVSFEEEALKAQAVAARTYALRQMGVFAIEDFEQDNFREEEIGQAFLTESEWEQRRTGANAEAYQRLEDVVAMTRGEILQYEEELIEAVFHSTSSGKTESSENMWQAARPYLVSVESEEDLLAPNFSVSKEVTRSEAKDLLMRYLQPTNTSVFEIKILERSDAGYVTKVSVFGKELSGAELRVIFDLRSSHFTLSQQEDSILFETKGYGHGVGMSQYGAHFMAQAGSLYHEILFHYYKDVEISRLF